MSEAIPEGELHFMLGWPGFWPDEPTILGEVNDGEVKGSLTAYPEQRFGVVLSLDGTETKSFHSPALDLIGHGALSVIFNWTQEHEALILNGIDVLATPPDQTPRVQAKTLIANGDLAWDVPDARKVCAEWMAWRRHHYGNPKASPKKGRKLKSESSQREELRRALTNLRDLVGLIRDGRQGLFSYVSTELRALLYWNGGNYNPLLLRLAARKDLPLPVFYRSESAVADILGRASANVRTRNPSVVRFLDSQTLGDLQEYLEQEVLTIERVGVSRTLTVRQVILEASSILGAAHYDEDIPDVLADLLAQGSSVSALEIILVKVAEVVGDLGEMVLAKWSETEVRA